MAYIGAPPAGCFIRRRRLQIAVCTMALALGSLPQAQGQLTENEKKAAVGDAPANPGPLATDLSTAATPAAVKAAMRKVADWQTARIVDTPSQDWTFATLYVGMLSASETLQDRKYHDTVLKVAEHYRWTLGPRKLHADDQAIGQAYLWLDREKPQPIRIAPLRKQFDEAMLAPDDPARPVWWWCDALFMAPPVWAGLTQATHDPKYLAYMDHEWRITNDLLWDPQARLFSRDQAYLTKHEKNGSKLFWSRGNGWVMGGLVGVLDVLPADDARRPFYVDKLQQMAGSVAKIQGADGLWRAGLLDAPDYALPETSGSAFFVYALAWGINHHLLDAATYRPVVEKGWAGLVKNVYADGRLGSVQPVGEAPGAYSAGASSVFGTGAFLLAGTEVSRMSSPASHPARRAAK
ncbi:glycoside hydrolase family 88/105 protein [Granulicella rosea]|nr:glycoside hydrolase family 88 protein [Granulicella rosea]